MASPEQIEFYNNFVQHFDEQKDNGRNRGFRGWTCKWVRSGSRVLDFGCALGYNSGYLTAMDHNCYVVGIDISPKCIEIAKQRYPNATWHCVDVSQAREFEMCDKLIEEPVNFIIMSDVIEHVPTKNHDNVFWYLSKYSAPGAALLVSVPNPEHYEESVKNTPQPVEEKLNIPELLGVMALHGFNRIVSLFLDGSVYYRMVVQKGKV